MLPRLILLSTAFIFMYHLLLCLKLKVGPSTLLFLLLIFFPPLFSLLFYLVCRWLNVVRHCSNRLFFYCLLYTWMGEANAFNLCMSRSERFNYVCFLCSFFVVRLIEDAQ
ncbi:hypothetical protein BDV36DRAFT_50241 [Aspergillus pseudocaelatus]|uniref:Uncharacterized protein n=1 Tax=Aspergillus pseudocaelatus TaxID=1825620 RepID=A0ABQ6W6I5_9EURO|nr:hypothetical protein BDV36DRAFT_50241 [Aspergillus pseudocaelatus]